MHLYAMAAALGGAAWLGGCAQRCHAPRDLSATPRQPERGRAGTGTGHDRDSPWAGVVSAGPRVNPMDREWGREKGGRWRFREATDGRHAGRPGRRGLGCGAGGVGVRRRSPCTFTRFGWPGNWVAPRDLAVSRNEPMHPEDRPPTGAARGAWRTRGAAMTVTLGREWASAILAGVHAPVHDGGWLGSWVARRGLAVSRNNPLHPENRPPTRAAPGRVAGGGCGHDCDGRRGRCPHSFGRSPCTCTRWGWPGSWMARRGLPVSRNDPIHPENHPPTRASRSAWRTWRADMTSTVGAAGVGDFWQEPMHLYATGLAWESGAAARSGGFAQRPHAPREPSANPRPPRTDGRHGDRP